MSSDSAIFKPNLKPSSTCSGEEPMVPVLLNLVRVFICNTLVSMYLAILLDGVETGITVSTSDKSFAIASSP